MNTKAPEKQNDAPLTTKPLAQFVKAVDEKNRWQELYDNPMPAIASLKIDLGVVGEKKLPLNPYYIGKAIDNFKNPHPFAHEEPGAYVVAEDIRIVLVLDNEKTEQVINGVNIGAAVSAAFAAASGTLSTFLTGIVPAQVLAAVIAGVAGIFSGFLWAAGAIINEVNQGKGIYLTVTVPQFIAAASMLVGGILFPPAAVFTVPAAALLCVPIPTSR